MTSVINLGALTTTFTAPASCYDLTVSSDSGIYWTTESSRGTGGSYSTTSYTTLLTPMWYEKFDPHLDINCYPSGAYRNFRTSAFYSPGICPEDWTTVEQSSPRGTVTAHCCPSGFTRDTSLCKSAIKTGVSEVAYFYQDTRSSNRPFTITENDIVWATAIEVRFTPGEVGPTTTVSSTTSQTTSKISTSETPGPTTGAGAADSGGEDNTGDAGADDATAGGGTEDPPQQTNSGGGLSNGAKIGIGIGVPLGVIAASALAFFLWWRRRRAHAAGADNSVAQPAPFPSGQPGGPPPGMVQAPAYDANGNQYAAVPSYDPNKTPAVATAAPVGAYYKPNGDGGQANELYAPGAHGGYAQQQQHQRPVSEVHGSSPNQSYNGVSPVGSPPISGVSPSQSPHQVSTYPSPQGQPQQYQPYQPQQQHLVHEAPDYQPAWNSNAGPVPDIHELYPETTGEGRRA